MKSRRKSVKSIWLSSLLLIDAEYLLSKEHCVKIVWKRSYFWSVFSYIWTEYGDSRSNLRIQSEYRKIRTRNNSVFGHFSRSRRLHLYMIKIRHGSQIHRLQNYLKIVYVDKKLALTTLYHVKNTAQKMKFSIKDFFSKYDQIRRKLWIWSHLLKKP